jgi:quercetin dioxygenase-like cupin family protein
MTAAIYFCAAALASVPAFAQVPLEQEPRHHLEFSNEWLRVISPRIPPGDTTLDHLHTHDDVTICIHGSEVRAKQPGTEWSTPGAVCVPGRIGVTEYTGKPRSHTVQNTGSGLYYLVLVENLRESGWKNNDPVSVAGMKVAKENRSFRVYETELSVTGEPIHSHEVPTVVVLVSGEALAGDKRLDQPGSWAYIPAGTKHQLSGHAKAQLVEIEVR